VAQNHSLNLEEVVMDKANVVKELINDVIVSNGYRLEDVLYVKEGSTWFLRVIIDKDGIINVDDCSRVTHLINPILDEADPISESYILDVCSMEKGD
jgi:ribosome maturation factor RimP